MLIIRGIEISSAKNDYTIGLLVSYMGYVGGNYRYHFSSLIYKLVNHKILFR